MLVAVQTQLWTAATQRKLEDRSAAVPAAERPRLKDPHYECTATRKIYSFWRIEVGSFDDDAHYRGETNAHFIEEDNLIVERGRPCSCGAQ